MASPSSLPHTGVVADAKHARHQQRVLRLLGAIGVLMLVLGAGWSTYFFVQRGGPVLYAELLLALMGVVVIMATRRQQVRLAAWMAFSGLYIFVCVFSALMDVQTAEIPRSTHLFLLVLAAAAHHVFRHEHPWARYGCMAVFLGTFMVFAALPQGVPTHLAISDDMRRLSIWVNLLSVVGSLLVVLHLQESDARAHRALHRALRDALAARQFELFYQPQVDAHGHIFGAEALLRWRCPKRGLVPPGEFIQAAEETGFMLALGQWVLADACEQLAQWHHNPTLASLKLSVNVSPMQLHQPDFVEQVLDTLHRTGVSSERLTLELTESMLLHDGDATRTKMQALQRAGVRLSLDDFGTGYSALAYLRQLPFAELKIDRAFVAEICRDTQAGTITRNLLKLGHDLAIDVIAEGVEHAEQHEWLSKQGCGYFQGYLFGKPMPRPAFEALVSAEAG